ncbi:MAG: phosphonate ABC transporter, permease protein PhnE [Hydrogenophaga sp.]|uniref:phosphonate ABC transporter, permease protein PhnE n=1 Tax=Hydrogenophaga sp. TaxID=1904254 RepID=UPI00273168C1|nr:phosphonate ABC transporter, permease protein PhnE [Hydrogenophaga sp.]MDP2405869.1 phosphonate ABC transporter, permease protein PhnE [Hydrogenophaga sp.]MDP3323823.1 phosphonate ABC transporter, permease protein PhnE [Hydrogenophaga sp.]MDZ4173067.1 phosphonate ABC transporter, permease protein PhnE [Hydrogenophaga sp.]
MLAYALLVAVCLGSLWAAGELSMGRNPLTNLIKSIGEFAYPSLLDVWFGPERLEYRSDDGSLLRVENRRVVEADFLAALGRATWVTFQIATLGSLLGAVLALPLGLLSARNLGAPRWLAWGSKGLLDVLRAIHTLVFGLVLVGIVGLGPTAGILAIALHSMGTYGKLYAESVEALDMGAIHAVQATGASRTQVFFNAAWPAVLPQFVSNHLYIWEFNIRDSTILGLIGAGGLGLLISEAVSLFQWSRLATILLVVIALVVMFDTLSRRIRQALL